jgi:hypothetical protein
LALGNPPPWQIYEKEGVRHLFQRVNVLRVVPEQGTVLLDALDEAVARRRLELARVDLARKLEERARVLPEVVDVEHGLRVGQVRKVDGESGVDAVTRPEVRNTAGHGDAGAREDDDFLRVPGVSIMIAIFRDLFS